LRSLAQAAQKSRMMHILGQLLFMVAFLQALAYLVVVAALVSGGGMGLLSPASQREVIRKNAERRNGSARSDEGFRSPHRAHVSALPKTIEAQVLGKQLLRSGPSIGANYREAVRARSKAEFIAKCGDSLREVEESAYRLELLVGSGIVDTEKLDALRAECDGLTAIFVTILTRAKASQFFLHPSLFACVGLLLMIAVSAGAFPCILALPAHSLHAAHEADAR
jgi:four helix bundle protein